MCDACEKYIELSKDYNTANVCILRGGEEDMLFLCISDKSLGVDTLIPINFCPMCGKSLKAEM